MNLKSALRMGAAGTVLALLLAAPAWAQNATQTTPPADETVVVVTGSHIASKAAASPSPLQTVTSKDLENAGAINVIEALQDNPAFGVPGSNRANSNFTSTQAGLSTVNLRNFGADRTLTLIDGRRSVAGRPGTTQVDLTMIPTPFVDRVEVLTGGASAVYGSDAVAGVVNFIYKKHFNGVLMNAQVGASEYGDDRQQTLNITVGSDFNDGRGNVMLYGGYSDEGIVRSVDRERSAVDQTSLGGTQRKSGNNDANLQAAQNLFVPSRPVYSTIIPNGTFDVGGKSYTIDQSGVRLFNSAVDGFNRAPYQAIAVPVTRYTFAGRGRYDFSDHVSLFLEGNFARIHSQTYMEPLPLQSAGALGIFRAVSNGHFNIEGLSVNPTTGASTLTRNPLVPDAIYNAATDTNADGLKDIGWTKRLVEFGGGQRFAPVDRDTFRIATGIDGSLNDNWKYELSYTYGQTTATQRMTGLVNEDNVANALNVVRDVYDLNKNGSTNDAICASAEARALGCVPLDIYGPGKLTAEMIKYIETQSLRNARQTQSVVSANLSGTLFELPAGPLQVSLGMESRREASSEVLDPLSNIPRNGYVQQVNVAGSFRVNETYAEIIVPLLANLPGIYNLTLRGAGRVSDYSTVGSVNASNIGLEYSPVKDIRFRAVYARAVRAPNIGELFGGSTVGVSSVADPCLGVTLAGTDATSVNCRKVQGVLTNIAASPSGAFTQTQSDTQGVPSLQVSNPNLHPEDAKTVTFGVVITPRSIEALRNFTFTADYYDIKLAGAIARPSSQFILTQCYTNNDPTYCALVKRRDVAAGPYSAGSIELINSALVNTGGAFTEGLDLTAAYRLNLQSWGWTGTATFQGSLTHLYKQGGRPLDTSPIDPTAGEVGSPRDKAQLSINYENGNWGFTWSNQFIGKQYLDDTFRARFLLANGQPAPLDLFKVKPFTYTDAQIRYRLQQRYDLYFGVGNLFNVAPPPIITGLPGTSTGTETAAGLYDPIGRRFYAGIRAKF